MNKHIKFFKNISDTNKFYVLSFLQVVSIIGYLFLIQGLQKPGGLKEALIFMVTIPAEYFPCLLLGIVSLVLNFILLISLCTRIPLIEELIEDNYYIYDDYEKISKSKVIIDLIIVISLLVLNIIFLKFLFSIIGIFILALIVIVILFK